jgi:hypothetical protein
MGKKELIRAFADYTGLYEDEATAFLEAARRFGLHGEDTQLVTFMNVLLIRQRAARDLTPAAK